MLVSIILAAILKDLEKSVAIDLVEGLLEVHEEQAALTLHTEDLGDALCGASALLEAVLVELRLEELRLRLDDLVEDGLLDDLGEVREDGDVAYLLAAGDGGALAFRESDHATDLEVIGDVASVERSCDVKADLVEELW